MTPCISLCIFFFISFLIQIPVIFINADAAACSYCDIEIKFCLLFWHPQNRRYSSASQHEIPVLSTNLMVYFQTVETFISHLTSVLAFSIIFDTISKNKRHKTHLRYYTISDSQYDKNKFFTLERTTSLEFYLIKRTGRTLPAAGNYSERQTERQTDRHRP